MTKIPFKGGNFIFPYTSLNALTEDIVDFKQILHAALTYTPRSTGVHYYFDVMRRIYTIFVVLDEHNGEYIPSIIYKNSDPSEKAFTSYVLGMTFCNYVALNKLGYDYLIHFHLAESNSVFTMTYTSSSKSRPDFIGCKFGLKGDYLVIEAKGLSSKYDDAVMKKGKDQANQILSINGHPPLKVVVQTYFDKNLKVNYEDPEGEGFINLSFDNDKLTQLYFQTIKRFFAGAPKLQIYSIADHIFLKTYIYGTNYSIGILKTIYDQERIQLGWLNEVIINVRENIERDEIYIGNDGIIIIKGTS